MARKRSTETIDAQIAKVMADMSKLQDRYNKLADKLKDLQEQKRSREADAIIDIDAHIKSGKSLEEILTFFETLRTFSVTFLQSSHLYYISTRIFTNAFAKMMVSPLGDTIVGDT